MFNNYNPYYGTPVYTMPKPDQQYIPQQQQQLSQSYFKNSFGLQGKSVDSLDVVKALDIPLDGSVSYFPLVDGSAIVTKQLQRDGTSKTIIYKPMEDVQEPTQDKIIQDLQQDIKVLKEQVQALMGNDKE